MSDTKGGRVARLPVAVRLQERSTCCQDLVLQQALCRGMLTYDGRRRVSGVPTPSPEQPIDETRKTMALAHIGAFVVAMGNLE